MVQTKELTMKRLVKLAVLIVASSAAISAQAQTTESSAKAEDKKIVHRDLAAREAATGLATGKAAIKSPRDIATGQASGKRAATGDVNGDGAAEVSKPRDSATGQASGKQVNEVKAPRDVATGQASGKRQHQPVTKTTGAQSSPIYKDAAKEGTNPLYEGKK